ncbi:MAG: AsmA family protein [Flavobacteriales bacterium]|nr:AsmA family protein [Flavobacteriales bacterium]
MAKKKKSLIKRILKWTGIVFLLLIVLAVALPYFFKDEIVQFIEDEAEKSLNAKLELGEVELSFISTFPDFVLEVKNMSLTGIDEFEGVTLFGAKKLELALDLNSVLFGESYEIKRFHLIEPEINILVTKDGKADYDIYKSDSTATTEEVATEEESAPFKLALQEYKIENASIVYSDSTMAFNIILENFTHEGTGDFTLDELILQTRTTADYVTMGYDGVNYLEKVETEIDCAIKMNLTTFRFEFQDNNARLNEFSLGFEGWFQMTDEYYDMDISFAAKDSKFKTLLSMVPGVYSPDFGTMKTDGTIGFSGRVFEKYSETSMPGFELDLTVENAFFQYPDLPGKVSNINIATSIKRASGPDLDNLVIDLKKAHAEFADNYVDASMRLSKPMSDPNFKGNVKFYLDLAKLASILPMEEGDTYEGIIDSDLHFSGKMSSIMEERYEEFEASGEATITNLKYVTSTLPYDVSIATAVLKFDPQQVLLESFESKIGESDISANGSFSNYLKYAFNDEALAGTFNVNANYINLDELMAFDEGGEVQAEPVPEEDVAEEPMEVIPLPENVNFDLNVDIKKILYDSMTINNVVGNINLANSAARLNDLKLEMLGGNLNLNGLYSTVNPAKPEVALDFDIEHFDIRKTAKYFNTVNQLAPIASKCRGFFSSKMSFKSELDKYWMPDYATIFGAGDLFTKKVFVEGFEPLNRLASKLKVDKLSKQTINDVKCFFKIVDGKIHLEPFDVKLGKIASTIAGSTSFEQDLDYVMTMDIPRSEMGSQADAFIDGLVSKASSNGIKVDVGDVIPVNIKILGKVTDPKITADWKEQGKNIMDDIKDQVIEVVTDQINDKLEDVDAEIQAKVDEIMKNAQEKADQLRTQGKKSGDQIRKEGKKAADQVRKEGNARADQMQAEADKKGALAVKIAKKPIEKVRNETEVKAKGVEKKADTNALKVEAEANAKADKLLADAQTQADKVRLDKRVGD